MMTMNHVVIFASIIGALIAFTNAANVLAADKKCGTKVCSLLQYCSRIYNQCENCQSVCETTSHNYDSGICTNECQDYLNEQRFAKNADFSAEIKQLRKQQTILLILVIILIILFVLVHGFHLFRWLRKKDYLSFKSVKHLKNNKNRPEQSVEITVANPHTQSPKTRHRKADVRVNSIYSVSGMDGTTRTLSTPISNRYPAEDSVDYTYDNVALQITPVHDKPRGETTF